MLGTYHIKEAQANLTKLCRSGRKFVISNGCMTKKWGFKLLLPRSLRNDLISDNSARR